MNVFRFAGDVSHLFSFLVLLYQLFRTKKATGMCVCVVGVSSSALAPPRAASHPPVPPPTHTQRLSLHVAGISLKTQELLLIVFLSRYMDLLTPFVTGVAPRFPWWMQMYLIVMKLFFIMATAVTVWMIRGPLHATYHREHDTYRHMIFGVVPAFVLAAVVTYDWHENTWWQYVRDVTWTFSIILESVAILPQLIVLQRHQDTSNITIFYIASLGLYRGLYVLNWIYRFWIVGDPVDYVSLVFGILQTILFSDFFIQYRHALQRLLPKTVHSTTGGSLAPDSAGRAPASVAKLFSRAGADHHKS